MARRLGIKTNGIGLDTLIRRLHSLKRVRAWRRMRLSKLYRMSSSNSSSSATSESDGGNSYRMRKNVYVKQVLILTSQAFGISLTELLSKSRKWPISEARLVCYLLLREAHYSWNFIGAIMRRDHSSAIHGAATIAGRLEVDAGLRETVDEIREKAIKASGLAV